VPLSADDRLTLLRVARESIAHRLAHGRPLACDPRQFSEPLREPRATFVTLHLESKLRGCVGSLEARRPLIADVAHAAAAAAFEDPRFPPLTSDEAPRLDLHISVLGPTSPIAFASEDDLLTQVRPGVDGLVLRDASGARGTFLPSVWDSLPEPRSFLAHLKMKAGLRPDHWSDTIRVWRYEVEDIS
jgi:uncharacterized protein